MIFSIVVQLFIALNPMAEAIKRSNYSSVEKTFSWSDQYKLWQTVGTTRLKASIARVEPAPL
jgi:hypothetical protein